MNTKLILTDSCGWDSAKSFSPLRTRFWPGKRSLERFPKSGMAAQRIVRILLETETS